MSELLWNMRIDAEPLPLKQGLKLDIGYCPNCESESYEKIQR